jgi:hypothetical protein
MRLLRGLLACAVALLLSSASAAKTSAESGPRGIGTPSTSSVRTAFYDHRRAGELAYAHAPTRASRRNSGPLVVTTGLGGHPSASDSTADSLAAERSRQRAAHARVMEETAVRWVGPTGLGATPLRATRALTPWRRLLPYGPV